MHFWLSTKGLPPTGLLVFFSIVSGITIANAKEAGENRNFEKLDPMVKQVCRWLPAETETLTYLSRDNKISPERDKLMPKSFGILSLVRKGKFIQQVEEGKIKFEVAGSCRFRPPKGMNGYRYAGCHAMVFARDLDKDFRNRLIKSFSENSNGVDTVKGYEVVRFEENVGPDKTIFYISLPKPNVLLVGTDITYITSVLDRVRASLDSSALRMQVALWDQLDVKAAFWGMRLPTAVENDGGRSDGPWENDGGFVTFVLEKKSKLIVRNLLIHQDKTTKAISRKWKLLPPNKSSPKLELVSPKVAEINLSTRDSDAEALFVLIIWRLGYKARL